MSDETMVVHRYREHAREFLESVVPATLSSEKADLVVQGRQHWAKYSSCGDLAHALYEHLGLAHRRINRAPAWRTGQNVSLLTGWIEARTISRGGDAKRFKGFGQLPVELLQTIDAGDVLIRWEKTSSTDAHVVCCVAPSTGGAIQTAEFGQAPPMIGRLFPRRLVGEGRPFRCLLRLSDVLVACGVDIHAEEGIDQ